MARFLPVLLVVLIACGAAAAAATCPAGSTCCTPGMICESWQWTGQYLLACYDLQCGEMAYQTWYYKIYERRCDDGFGGFDVCTKYTYYGRECGCQI